MRAEDLDHEELLELDPEGGVIRFAGQRALLLDAVAMGLLRKYLVENFGLTAARTVLTQFGFAHGWRMAEAMQAEFKWDSDEEWRRAGTRIHALEGLFRVEPGGAGPLSKQGVMLVASYEAEQHLLHFGRSDVPVCWTICGLTSGYLSRSAGKEIYVLEDRCMGKGDAACHLVGRTREEWGDERAEELRFFEPKRLEECLDVSLQRVTETLKAAERKLREHRRALVRVAPRRRRAAGHRRQEPARCGSSWTWRAAWRRSTPPCSSPARAARARSASRGSSTRSRRARRGRSSPSTAAPSPRRCSRASCSGTRAARSPARPRIGPACSRPPTAARCCSTRSARSRRACRSSCCACCRSGRSGGSARTRAGAVDVRVVAATNRDLAHGVAGGAFRQDLYYRLKVVELHVPPLRERRDDVLPLARVLLADAALRMKRKIAGLAPGAADQLLRYEWPGNVRELENAMERAVALARGSRVELEDLPGGGPPGVSHAGGDQRERCGRSTRSRRNTSSRRWSSTAATRRAPPSSSTSARRRCTASSRATA